LKYKCLLNILKNSKEYTLLNSDRNTDTAQASIYYELINIKISLEEDLDRRLIIIDKFLDGIYLSKVLINKDINKVYKALTTFMKNCSEKDFRVLYLYRLKLYNFMLKESIPYEYCYLIPYVTLTIICGGILYLPLSVGNKSINLGKDLDDLVNPEKFFSSKLVKEDFKLECYYRKEDEKLNSRFIESKKKEIATNCFKKSLGFLNTYIEKLLSIYNCLHIPTVNNNVKEYVDLDLFKLVIKDVDDDLGKAILDADPKYVTLNISALFLGEGEELKTEFKFPNLVVNSDLKTLRERKYILPKGGVVVVPEIMKKNSSLILEGYDDLIGYYICQLSDNGYDKHFNLINLTTNVNNIYKVDVNLLSLFNLYKVPYTPLEKSDKVFNTVNEGLRVLDFKDMFKAVYNIDDCVVKIKGCNYIYEDIHIDIFKPSYWKYKGIANNSNHKELDYNKNLLAEKIVKINAFKRKLPSGNKRSNNADLLSKKYCIDLEEDETIVSSFERKQKVKL